MEFCVFIDLINEYVLCISTILLICVYLFNKFNKSIIHKIVHKFSNAYIREDQINGEWFNGEMI